MDDLAESRGEANAKRRFLTFRIEQRLYALAAAEILEVIRVPAAARVPQSPDALLGIANLRGSILPLVSLRALLGVADVGMLPDARAIVLANGPVAALVVDAVEALVTIDADRVETRQAELAAGAKERLTGAFQGDAGAAKILDIQNLLDAAFVKRARSPRQTQARALAAADDGEHRHTDADMLVTFDVAGREFALRLEAVEEIAPRPEAVARMPDAEEPVLGMMAFRDRLLPLFSLRGLLGVTSAEGPAGREKIVITMVGGGLVGLVADRARAVVAAERDRVDPIPSLLAARIAGEAKISAIYRGEGGRRLISILAPERLFREDVMRRLESQRPAAMAPNAEIRPAAAAERKFLVFRLGEDEFGLPIDAVDEVARVPDKITRLPKTPKFLAGVVNLRGDVLPVVDQRRRFDMPKLERGESRRLIVVRTERHRAGLIVDSVSEVMRCAAEAIEATPSLTDDTSRLIHGIVNLDETGRIVLLLDPAELLTRAEQGLLDSFAAALGPTPA
ncbi:MAG: chemotaxis protein CheW [Stellaceae bacterium]